MTSASVTRQLVALFEDGSLAGLSDRQLIERFLARCDDSAEAAFAALVARHGPMVLGVCRQLLGDHHQAEDAFQAAFLVLARKARSLRDPDRLATWMYGVTLRTARKARTRLARRRRHEEGDIMNPTIAPTGPPADQALLDRDRAEALHGEIDRLPEAFRTAVVLCYFEGLTLDQAAIHLGCPAGTLRSRLARARDKLRRALTRRGVALPGAALAAALDGRSAPAAVSTQLCDLTARAAIRFAAGQAAASTATTLAREVLRAMTIHKLKPAFATVLIVAAFAVGMGQARTEPRPPEGTRSREGEPPGEPFAQAARTEPRRPDEPGPAAGRMFVVGRVLDPQGKPVPGATVAVALRPKVVLAPMNGEGTYPVPVGHATSDAGGRFRIDAPRTSASRHAEVGVTAVAPGYGVGWADLGPDEDRPAADITLSPEQVIEGRLTDANGQPVAGAVVSVSSVFRTLPVAPLRTARGRLVPSFEGSHRWWGRVNDASGWPAPVASDADGRFSLRGVGRGARATLEVFDPRFAVQRMEAATDAPGDAKPLTAKLQPARTVTGRVTYADTGRPAARAEVRVGAIVGQGAYHGTIVETDADGRFRARPIAGDRVSVAADPPDGQPYFAVAKSVAWPEQATEQVIDLGLPRGALIRGKVTEAGTGAAVPDAAVYFVAHHPAGGRIEAIARARTKADGSFALGVGPHPGHLSILAPLDDYPLQAISNAQFYQGQGGGKPVYANAFVACNPKPGADPVEVAVELRRGATVKLLLVGPDGQPVPDVRVYSQAVLGPSAAAPVRIWDGLRGEIARHGQLTVHGLDPDREVLVSLLQPERKLGATIKLSGKSGSGGPITVRLEPCGQALARLVGPDGAPVAGELRGAVLSLVVTPGPPGGSAPVRAGALAADEAALSRVDPVNYASPQIADDQGRIVLPALIPGATYRIIDRTAVVARNAGDGPQVRREFTVGPGEAIALGDILVAKPQGRD
jgi:RNA polymerase sigma factor (sigma-70 family)